MILLGEITKLLPPPERPAFADGDWDAVTVALGTRIPSDYIALLRLYGTGAFAEEIVLTSPFVADKSSYNLQSHLETLQIVRERGSLTGSPSPEHILPVPVFPEEGGILRFAIDGNGFYYVWRTYGADPDNWITGIYNIRDDEPEGFQLGALELLYGIMSKTLEWSGAATFRQGEPHGCLSFFRGMVSSIRQK